MNLPSLIQDLHTVSTIPQQYSTTDSQHSQQPPLRIAIAGGPYNGKTTLLGHFLYNLDIISSREVIVAQNKANECKEPNSKWSFLLDKTVQSHKTFHSTTPSIKSTIINSHSINFIDIPSLCPRYVAVCLYAANMVIFVIDSIQCYNNGYVDQITIDHMIIAKAMGIQHYIVVINKLDLCNYNRYQFQEVCNIVATTMEDIGYNNPIDINFTTHNYYANGIKVEVEQVIQITKNGVNDNINKNKDKNKDKKDNNNMRSRWWDDYNGTYIPEEIADDESLLYKTICTSQYFQLYDYQHARRQWRYIKYPNTMDILNRLFSLLGGNINDESFIYGVIAPNPQIPYIIRLFIFLYIAHASESLLY